MTRRKIRRPGRPSLLSDEVRTKLVEATKIGSPMSVAAQYSGVAVRTFEQWMARGFAEEQALADGETPDEDEARYLELYQEVMQARASAAVNAVVAVRKASLGGAITEETTRKYRDAEGNLVEETTVKKTAPDWRSAAWYLERQHRAEFGQKQQLDVSHGGKVEVDAESAAQRIHNKLQELLQAEREREELAAAATPPALPAASGEVIPGVVLPADTQDPIPS